MTLHCEHSSRQNVIFGPVPSRRLGRSLGIDLTPHKTCSFDCIYCECGRTTDLTTKRKLFVDPDRVLFELKSFFDEHGKQFIDAITFSGSGEPTLYKELGYLINSIKSDYPNIPVGILTNGSLFWQSDVRKDAINADFVIPSLDAPNPTLFKKINRPHENIKWESYIQGLKLFCQEYKGNLRLEVFLLKDLNSTKESIDEFKNLLLEIKPPMVELNTLVRPGVEKSIAGLFTKEMKYIASRFEPINCKIIGKYEKKKTQKETVKDLDSLIIKILSRRPCTLDEMSDSLGIPQSLIATAVNRLVKNNLIRKLDNFYFAGSDRKSVGIV